MKKKIKGYLPARLTCQTGGIAAGLCCALQAHAACNPDLRSQPALTVPSHIISTPNPLPISTDFSCATYQLNAGGVQTVVAGGQLGDAIMNGGKLEISNGGTLTGIVASGEIYAPLNAGPIQIYGVQGDVVVDHGGKMGLALIGTGSTLTVGGPAASPTPAAIGTIVTAGTVVMNNALMDGSLDLDATSAHRNTFWAIQIDGGSVTIDNSIIHGNGSALAPLPLTSLGAILVNDPLVPAGTTPISLNITNTTIDKIQGGITVTQQIPGNQHPYVVNLTDTQILNLTTGSALDVKVLVPNPTPTTVTVTRGVLQGPGGLNVSTRGPGVKVSTQGTTISGTTLSAISGNRGMGAFIAGPAEVTLDGGTKISGITDGAEISTNGSTNGPQVQFLNGTSVQGQGGAGLHISNRAGQAAQATITVASGSTLTGSNGNSVQVDGGGQALLTTDAVNLGGNVLVTGAGSALQWQHQNGASLAGNMSAAAGGNLAATFANASATGNFSADGAGSSASLSLGTSATLTGNASATNSGQLSVQANGATARLDGGVTADNGTANVQIGNGAQLTGQNGLLVHAINGGTATAAVSASALTGDMLQDASSTLNVSLSNGAALAGNLASTSLSVADSTWTMGAQASQSVGALSMSNGNVIFNSGAGPFKTLNASSLQGSGAFTMGVDFKPGGGNDQLNVSGAVTGSHVVDAYGEDQGVESPRNNIPVVLTGGGAGTFGLKGTQVDAGIYTYHLVQQGTQWVLLRNGDLVPPDNGNPPDNGGNPNNGGNPDVGGNPNTGGTGSPPPEPDQPSPDTLSPAAKTALSLASAIPDVWYNEVGTLRLRQGDLRANRAGDGLWARSFTSLEKFNSTAAPAFDMDQYGILVGADKRLETKSGDLYVGVLGSYSYFQVKIGGGSTGRVNSYGLGAYATYMMENGWYMNGLFKANSFDNELRVVGSDGRGSRGSYSMPGMGLTLELGKHIPLPREGFLEPYVQAAGFTANSAKDTLDNNFEIHNGNTKSLRGEIGMLLGQNYALGKDGFIQPYLKGAFIHEFVDDNRTALNNVSFTDDLSGTRMLVGLGVTAQVKKNLQFHLDADYTTGGPINQSVDFTLGMRYVW